MSEFKREERYKVLKLTDVSDALTYDEIIELNRLSNKVAEHRHYDGRPPLECVCIESDWPIYEEVWDMVQRLAEGREQKVDELKQQLEQAQARSGDLETLCDAADCPQCGDKSGAYYDGYGEVCQCQWCDERNKSPAQSLADIEVRAVEKAMDDQFPDIDEHWNQHEWTVNMCRAKLKYHAEKLRQQVGSSEND